MATSLMRQLIKDLDVDERTSELSDEALVCRSRGHKWEDRALTRKRYAEMLMEGFMIDAMYCGHGCGCTWEITWAVRNGEVIESKREYPRDRSYLLPSGTGRLHRNNARVARAARSLATAA